MDGSSCRPSSRRRSKELGSNPRARKHKDPLRGFISTSIRSCSLLTRVNHLQVSGRGFMDPSYYYYYYYYYYECKAVETNGQSLSHSLVSFRFISLCHESANTRHRSCFYFLCKVHQTVGGTRILTDLFPVVFLPLCRKQERRWLFHSTPQNRLRLIVLTDLSGAGRLHALSEVSGPMLSHASGRAAAPGPRCRSHACPNCVRCFDGFVLL